MEGVGMTALWRTIRLTFVHNIAMDDNTSAWKNKSKYNYYTSEYRKRCVLLDKLA